MRLFLFHFLTFFYVGHVNAEWIEIFPSNRHLSQRIWDSISMHGKNCRKVLPNYKVVCGETTITTVTKLGLLARANALYENLNIYISPATHSLTHSTPVSVHAFRQSHTASLCHRIHSIAMYNIYDIYYIYIWRHHIKPAP